MLPRRQVAGSHKSQCTARNLLRHFAAGNAYQSSAARCPKCPLHKLLVHTQSERNRKRGEGSRESERNGSRAIAHNSQRWRSSLVGRCGKNLTKLMCQISRRRAETGGGEWTKEDACWLAGWLAKEWPLNFAKGHESTNRYVAPFIHSTFICQLLRFYFARLLSLPWLLCLCWALGGNNLNFSNPLGIQTSSCSSGNSPGNLSAQLCRSRCCLYYQSGKQAKQLEVGGRTERRAGIRTKRRPINDAIKSTFLFVALFVLPSLSLLFAQLAVFWRTNFQEIKALNFLAAISSALGNSTTHKLDPSSSWLLTLALAFVRRGPKMQLYKDKFNCFAAEGKCKFSADICSYLQV